MMPYRFSRAVWFRIARYPVLYYFEKNSLYL